MKFLIHLTFDWFQITGRQVGKDLATMLPIVIGSVSLVILLFFITIYIVRKKKSELKYDIEKAEGKSEECQNLNSCIGEKDTEAEKE